MTTQPQFRGDTPVEFASFLAELKERGCNLLVTGEVAERVTCQATRRLLGSAAERRRRVLVLADPAEPGSDAYLPHGVALDDASVLAWNAAAHSTAASASTAAAGTDVASLRADVCATVRRLDATADGLAPAELRLGVVMLASLLDRAGDDSVRRALDAVTDQVDSVRGMGHYHLPVPDDADVVRTFDGLFDARIELRQADGATPEQRWHAPGYGTTTWVTL